MGTRRAVPSGTVVITDCLPDWVMWVKLGPRRGDPPGLKDKITGPPAGVKAVYTKTGQGTCRFANMTCNTPPIGLMRFSWKLNRDRLRSLIVPIPPRLG